MKKVLIITYYWPPSGGAGVQRWLKFVKYLRNFGWEPIVYTPENPEMPVADESLQKDVPADLTILKTKIREPYSFYKFFIGKKKDEKINSGFLSENKKPRLTEKIAVWIRGNFFIPDARIFWIRPSVKFLSGFLSENKVDAIVSTGPPHSLHLIALELKNKFGIPWLADFRDPWTNIYFYDKLMLSAYAHRQHKKLEKQVLQQADCVVTVGEIIKNELLNLGAKKAAVITNGFDEDDTGQFSPETDKKFSIAHIGSLLPVSNSEILWQCLQQLCSEIPGMAVDLEIKLVGKVDFSVHASLKKYNLERFVNQFEYFPHSELIKVQSRAQVLLLLLPNTGNSRGILTGKLFEYLSARRPILAIGATDGDMAKILLETNAGKVSGFDDAVTLKNNILEYYNSYKSGTLKSNSHGIEKYSRKELTKTLATLLESFFYFPEGKR